ncbi:hypothetical protein BD770DRAFT_477494 [Pilaira anomala]|nr:hypothetical protein BD770DRAFT_477494 [Pilaira anomala]
MATLEKIKDQSKATPKKIKAGVVPIEGGLPILDIPPSVQPKEEDPVMVQMGGGLPDLPAIPPPPQRQQQQAVPSASNALRNSLPQRVPNVKQAIQTQMNGIPSGSDLGIVGKLGQYQINQHTSSATTHHLQVNNLFLYMFIFVTFILIKKRL